MAYQLPLARYTDAAPRTERECASQEKYNVTMRWMLALCLGIALAAEVRVEAFTINTATPGIATPSTTQNPTLASFLIPAIPKGPEVIEQNLTDFRDIEGDEPSEASVASDEGNSGDVEAEEPKDSNENGNESEDGISGEGTGNGEDNSSEPSSEQVVESDEIPGSDENKESSEIIPESNESENGNGVNSNESETTSKEKEPGSDENKSRSNESGPSSNENGQGSNENGETSEETGQTSNEDGQGSKESGQVDSGSASGENEKTSSSEEKVVEETDAIETESGLVQGYILHPNHAIRSYLDIPYGRFTKLFAAPVKHPSWEEIRQIKEHNKRCPQLSADDKSIGDFDCLTLSVFTPKNADNLPVLFHIYDSQFNTGSADHTIYGPEYLTKEAIIVLPNYRIGPLGFLCLLDDVAPGNAALKDLGLALEWTKDNIEKFGGNASKIVVSGDGMTAALAGYLALSPRTRDLVSGVITESGSPFAHWALDRNPVTTAEKLLDDIKDDLTESVVDELLTSTKNMTFKPCLENGTNAFLNATPWEILNYENNEVNIPFMIGSASNAGMQDAVEETSESLEQLDKDFSVVLPKDLQFDGVRERSDVAEKVRKLYFNDRSITENELQNVSLFYTDTRFLGPAIRFSRALVKAGAKVYFYEFSFVGDLNRESLALAKPLIGAARGDIIGYTFTQEQQFPSENTDEEHMVELITDLWLSFMKDGKPSSEGVTWTEFKKADEDDEEWLSIDAKTELQKGLHLGRLQLWTEIYENHFVERNLAITLESSFLVFTTSLLFFGIFMD